MGSQCSGELLIIAREPAKQRKNALEILVPVPAKTARTARGILRGDIARQDCRFAHKIAVSLSLYVILFPFDPPRTCSGTLVSACRPRGGLLNEFVVVVVRVANSEVENR